MESQSKANETRTGKSNQTVIKSETPNIAPYE